LKSSDFRVHRTRKAAGFFILSAVFMIAEKAADRMLADASQKRA